MDTHSYQFVSKCSIRDMVGTFANRLVRSVCAVGCMVALPAVGQVREIVCYSDVFSPYVIQEGDDIRGIDVDAIAEAGRRVGIKVRFQLLPWVRLERDIALGERSDVECAFAYTLTDARKAYMDFTTVPVKLTELSIFARTGTFPSFKGIEDLKGKTVGIRRGFKLPAAMQAMVENGVIQMEEVNRDPQNFEKLARGRLHAVLSNREVGNEVLEQMASTDIVALLPSVQTTPTYMVFNKAKGLSALIPLFDKGFKSMVADGTYRKIRARYL
jgi:polar amino acid transport system substrate-binding protein